VVTVRLRDGELTVGNRGAPIAADDLARLAEPFERLQRGSGRGTGLGLSIVKAIAESHEGRLVLEAPAGGGLVARLAIPRAEPGALVRISWAWGPVRRPSPDHRRGCSVVSS
jgi:signal transduction histidine kinase